MIPGKQIGEEGSVCGWRLPASFVCCGTHLLAIVLSVSNGLGAESNTVSPGIAARTATTAAVTLNVEKIEHARVIKAAQAALQLEPPAIARHRAKLSAGGPNDFYSNADYFWPDPSKPDGLPYVNRDGESNPGNFNEHRIAMRQMRDAVAALAAAYKITGEERYVTSAVKLLRDTNGDGRMDAAACSFLIRQRG